VAQTIKNVEDSQTRLAGNSRGGVEKGGGGGGAVGEESLKQDLILKSTKRNGTRPRLTQLFIKREAKGFGEKGRHRAFHLRIKNNADGEGKGVVQHSLSMFNTSLRERG